MQCGHCAFLITHLTKSYAMLNKIIHYFLHNKLITLLLIITFIAWGLITAPFGWNLPLLPSDPVPVDAIPDIGENQQIVFTEWQGQSPQDIEDQVTYPLTTALLGIPGVKSIRSSSVFGFSSIYLIFNEQADFYWSRSRILEKISSLPGGLLPEGVQPALGPDATALGQVYWYTIEGRDPQGHPTGGWGPEELRTVQDFFVKYALSSVQDVSEVASIGGYVKEYQIDINPDILRVYNISLDQVMMAVKQSNRDVGAKTIEINKVEYLVRGIGYIKSVSDIEEAVVTIVDKTPIRIKDLGIVTVGPASRRGALDKNGTEAVGGVVVARYGSNPMQVINQLKLKIKEISGGLPQKTLSDGTKSQLTIVPFYDRSGLIKETLGTLKDALSDEVLITILVVVVLLLDLKTSFVISGLLPLAILMAFVAMRYFKVDANIVALSGIAIAIGTMVDLGIILLENVSKHLKAAPPGQALIQSIYEGAAEVSSAILTGVSTTVISFIPVFTMTAAEGKLFRPLAFTKTFALSASLLVSFLILPSIAHWVLGFKPKKTTQKFFRIAFILGGIFILLKGFIVAGLVLIALGTYWLIKEYTKLGDRWLVQRLPIAIAIFVVSWLLAGSWMPLGAGRSMFLNFIFVLIIMSAVLTFFILLEIFYPRILDWTLRHKRTFLTIPFVIVFIGVLIWLGFEKVFGFTATGFEKLGVNLRQTEVWNFAARKFPGMGKEFMPSLNEGSFLLMPVSMPHAGIDQNLQTLQQLDVLLSEVPEIEASVGKMGRAETALDPAPISMYETVINYKTEYITDGDGNKKRFKADDEGNFYLTSGETLSNDEVITQNLTSKLIPDEDGIFFRNWRSHIKNPDDIWAEISNTAKIPGVTSAPKLQPIQTRLIMLQTGMRAPMGIKVFGPDLASIESFGLQLEGILKQTPAVEPETVFADRVVGKPYMYINIDRVAIARYGLRIEDVQKAIETAIGGMKITSTVEGRERFPVRVRYPRELRTDPEDLESIYLSTPVGGQIPLGELATIEYVRGPQMIKSENTFLVSYVLFDKKEAIAEVDAVQQAQSRIQQAIDSGALIVPKGVTYRFSGNYENQIRAEKRLSVVVPLSLLIIFLILYFQFKSISTSLMVFSSISMAFSGAFLIIWLYGETWFLNFSMFGVNLRDLFQMHMINLSVAVWVGFIALFGVASDDSVLIATYMDQHFARLRPKTIEEVREAVKQSGMKRIKPAVMTAATTVIALIPVLTSQGRGADIMVPMSIPSFGGLIVSCITFFITPVLYCLREERKIKRLSKQAHLQNNTLNL